MEIDGRTGGRQLSIRKIFCLKFMKNSRAIPEILQVEDFIVCKWPDGGENYFAAEFLRENSPSASNMGEVDILGVRHGGDGPRLFPGVRVLGWEIIGNYAVRFRFSDGHATGLFSWDYLKKLADSAP